MTFHAHAKAPAKALKEIKYEIGLNVQSHFLEDL
jgi:hypothetical protein